MERNGITLYGKQEPREMDISPITTWLHNLRIEKLHPGKKLVFGFDNSTGHHKRPPDGLDASLLPLKDGGKNAPMMRNTTYFRRGIECQQLMQNSLGEQKGLKSILTERALWRYDMALICVSCKQREPHEKRFPGAHYMNTTIFCCARTCLANQPDFLAQREWLREVVEESPQSSIIYFPKFHPELNHIEMVWCYIKQIWKRKSDNKFQTLEAEIPKIIQEVPVSFIRKTERHCLKRMEGYRQGVSGPFLDFIMRRQKSHRTIDKDGIQLARTEYIKKYPHMKEATILRQVLIPTLSSTILSEVPENRNDENYAEI